MTQLWLPLIGSAVGVFIASSLIHMVFKWHNADYRKLSNEDEVAAAIRKGNATTGQYVIPQCLDMKQMQSSEMQKRYNDGPVGYVVLAHPGPPKMGTQLGRWFALNLLTGAIVACICAAVLPAGAGTGRVFHIAGLVTFAAYGVGAISDGIWFARPWRSVAKDLLDALIYAAMTGVTFAVFWPN